MKYTLPIKPLDSGRIIFLSDLHYGHTNIIKHCSNSRGNFNNVIEMNKWIIDNIFFKFNENDIIFDLGDTFWKTSGGEIEAILNNTKGRKFKLLGNHDPELPYKDKKQLGKYYEIVTDILDIRIPWKDKDYQLTLCHYPIISWNHKFWGSWMIHGHSHGGLDEFNDSVEDLRVDVGIDANLSQSLNKPWIEFEDLLNHFNNKILKIKEYGRQ